MAFDQERSLAASSAFTMAAVVGFITIWFNLNLGNNSRVVESLDTAGLEAQVQGRELNSEALRAQSFLRLLKLELWSLDLPHVIISDERPLAYEIQKNSITMGRRLALSRGQLSRALFRAVLSRNVAGIDVFHRDLFADALYFMMEGQFNFADPINGPVITRPNHWLSQINSLRGVCHSSWKPLELMSVCDSKVDTPRIAEWDDTVSVFSLKPAILAKFSEHLANLSVAKRLEFSRAWAASVASKPWTLPAAISALDKIPAVLAQQLNESFGLENNFDDGFFLYRISSRDFRIQSALLRTSQMEFPLIFEIEGQIYLNHLRVPAREIFSRQFMPSKMIWQVCDMPALGELARLKAKSNRVLLVRGCSQLTSGFRAYFLNGTESFSSTDGKSPYLSVFLPSVEMALKWGARADQRLEFGSDRLSRLERLLGFNEPRLSGAIPLIDSYRSDKQGSGVRLSN